MNGYGRYIDWKPLSANQKILQIYSKGLEYALVSKDYKQCHPFVWCKDFLQDVIFSTLYKKSLDIYQFTYNPTIDPEPCLDRVRILLTNAKDKKFGAKIPACLDFLNQIENHLEIKSTFVRECRFPPENYEKSGIFMFEGNKRWIKAPPMMSLYTLLLRIGFVHVLGTHFSKTIDGIKTGDIKPYQKKDSYWLKNTESALDKILRVGDKQIFHRNIKQNYPEALPVDTIHNRLGIMGFATEMMYKSLGEKVLVPHWHS